MKHPIRKRYILGGILLFSVMALIAARVYLSVWLLDYVNGVLKNIPGYQGSVESIDIHLYRGAYRIHQLKLYKKTGHIPTPFLDVDTADLSIQWSALIHGRIVSNVDLLYPVINFAVNPSGTQKQTGAGVDWNKPLRALMPIDINLVTFREGKLTYQDFSTTPKVNIYIHHMSGEIRNLRNVVDKSQPLPSTLMVKGDSIGNGALQIKGRMNILKRVTDMDMDIQLENVHLAALTDYSNAYAAIDIKGGNLNVYSEVIVKDGHVSGYVKPIATHVSLIDLRKSTNPVKLAWESVIAVIVEIFTNHAKEQFATEVPLSGNVNNVDTDMLSALGGIVRNAFVQALTKGVDHSVAYGK